MKGMHESLKSVLKNINKVKKTLRNKKYCFDECNDEKIKKIFLLALKADLFQLSKSLDFWIDHGLPMEETDEDKLL